MKSNRFHKGFQLNNQSFTSVEEILLFSSTISKSVHTFLKDWFSKSDFVIVHTSGSTGTPKPIRIQKEYMMNSALATGSFFNALENTKALLCLSTDFIAGKMMLVRALFLGWQLDIVLPASNPLEGVYKTYDFCAMVPLQLENSIPQVNQIKKLIVGGGVVSETLKLKLENKQTNVFATYGMTETVTHIAVRKLNHFISNFEKENSVYQTLPNIIIYKDERDCLVIDAPSISKSLVFTNDRVQLISETQFQWQGRLDTVVNSGGIKLYPEEIENKIATLIKERFFIIGIPDTYLGEKLILVVEKETTNNLEAQQLLKELLNLKTLSKFQSPKKVYFISKFIETATGKVSRKETLSLLF